MNAINSLWNWNREIAVKVEFHVSLIERVNRERLEAIALRDTARQSFNFETYDKAVLGVDALNEQLANFGLELVALLKLESTPEASDEPTQPDDSTSEAVSSADEATNEATNPDAPTNEGDLVRFRDDAHARAFLGLPPARDPQAPSFPKMLAFFERLAHEGA